jgi:hypothetical protein
MVLFLLVILVTMGFGFLGSRVGEYQSTAQAVLAAQARALARSGIEDARTKFNRDPLFPPPAGLNQTYFAYTENVFDVSTPPNYLGAYKVTIDLTYYLGPNLGGYFSITSIGGAGGTAPGKPPLATHAYRAYLNGGTGVPVWPTPPPAKYFEIVRFDDLGSPTWGGVSTSGI